MATVLSSNSANSAGSDNQNSGQGGLGYLDPMPHVGQGGTTPFPKRPPYPPATPLKPPPLPDDSGTSDIYADSTNVQEPDSLFEEIHKWLLNPLNSCIILISLILLLFLM